METLRDGHTAVPSGLYGSVPSTSFTKDEADEPFDELIDLAGTLFERGVWNGGDDFDTDETEMLPDLDEGNPDQRGAGLPTSYEPRFDTHYVDELLDVAGSRQIISISPEQIDTQADAWDDVPEAEQFSAVDPWVSDAEWILMESVRSLGILQPLIVRRSQGRFRLLAGHRRLTVARKLKLKQVPCVLYDVNPVRAEQIREAANLFDTPDIVKKYPLDQETLHKILPAIGESAHTVLSCLHLASAPGSASPSLIRPGAGGSATSATRDHGAAKLIESEARHIMQWTSYASVLNLEPSLNLAVQDLGALMNKVLREEINLGNLDVLGQISRPCVARVDRRFLMLALTGMFDALLPMVRDGNGQSITVYLKPYPEFGLAVARVQHDLGLPKPTDAPEWNELLWKDRPGGLRAATGMLAARRIAELHGGSLHFDPNGQGGALSLQVPLHDPR